MRICVVALGKIGLPLAVQFASRDATVVRAAREANAGMPECAVGRLEEEYGDLDGAKVAVVGATYRGGFKETAFSGVFPVVAALRERGAQVRVHDPLFTDAELAGFGWQPDHLGDPVDAVIIQANHAENRTLLPSDLPGGRCVVDGRRSLDLGRWHGRKTVHIGDSRP